MDKDQHIPKYAAGGEMDRLIRPNRNSYSKRPPGRLFLLLVLGLLLVYAAKYSGFVVPSVIQQTISGSVSPEDSFVFRDVTSNYDPETGVATISGCIRAVKGTCYNVKLTLEYSASGTVFYMDTQNIQVLPWNKKTDFTFQFDLKEQCALHDVPENASFNYKLQALGYFHI